MNRGLGLAVAVAGVLVAAGCGSTPMLRTDDVEQAVDTGLAEQVGGSFTVACPTDVPVMPGATFTCQAVDAADGTAITVTVTLSDDQGAFTWQVTSVP